MKRTSELESQYAERIDSLSRRIASAGEDNSELRRELEKLLWEYSQYRQGRHANFIVRRELA